MQHPLYASAYFTFHVRTDVHATQRETHPFGLTLIAESGGNVTLILGDEPEEARPLLKSMLDALEELIDRLPDPEREAAANHDKPFHLGYQEGCPQCEIERNALTVAFEVDR